MPVIKAIFNLVLSISFFTCSLTAFFLFVISHHISLSSYTLVYFTYTKCYINICNTITIRCKSLFCPKKTLFYLKTKISQRSPTSNLFMQKDSSELLGAKPIYAPHLIMSTLSLVFSITTHYNG